MGNPTFITQVVLNYLGDGNWEIYDHSMMLDTPAYQGDDESTLINELVAELATQHFAAFPIPPEGMVTCLLAGELVHSVYDGPEGREYNMDIEVHWKHFRVLTKHDIEVLVEPDLGGRDVELI